MKSGLSAPIDEPADLPPIDIQPDQWRIVKDILQKHVPRYEVRVFGSRVKGNAKPFSDLDLAVMTDRPLPIATRAMLAEDFSESALPWKVDVLDWAATGEAFRNIVAREGVAVQQAARPAP